MGPVTEDLNSYYQMTIEETIEIVVSLAQGKESHKGATFMRLLEASGYFELYEKITEDKIRDQLTQNPKLVQDWMDWSGDGRSGEGWYFKRNDDGFYALWFSCFEGDSTAYQIEYSDAIEACAAFVKRALEESRTSVLKRGSKREIQRQKKRDKDRAHAKALKLGECNAMDVNKAIVAVVELARNFKLFRNMSPVNLLKASGYFELYEEITEDKMREQLMRNPRRIKDWLYWSDHTRPATVWHLERNNKEVYVLWRYRINGDENSYEEIEYSDSIDACAAFVKRTIEQLRLSVLEDEHEREQRRQYKRDKNKARNDSSRN